ncbi:hypothetical protein ACFL2E_05445 [Thermodesulfobacteriota bacterium]
MTHEDAGHYASKHPKGVEADPKIVEQMRQKLSNNHITCAAAHAVAADLSVPPSQVGMTIDLLEARIIKCQMGLFGYSPKKNIVKPAKSVSSELKNAIETKQEDNRISCEHCWKIASQQGLQKPEVASACETLGMKVKPCQLGAF